MSSLLSTSFFYVLCSGFTETEGLVLFIAVLCGLRKKKKRKTLAPIFFFFCKQQILQKEIRASKMKFHSLKKSISQNDIRARKKLLLTSVQQQQQLWQLLVFPQQLLQSPCCSHQSHSNSDVSAGIIRL